MLKIRLTRMGKKHQPSYRVVVTPKENPVKGQYLDLVGTYNPLKEEINLELEKIGQWLDKGALPSERVARLLAKAGLKHKSIIVKHYQPKAKTVVMEPVAEKENQSDEDVVTESTDVEETPSTDSQSSAEEAKEGTDEANDQPDQPKNSDNAE